MNAKTETIQIHFFFAKIYRAYTYFFGSFRGQCEQNIAIFNNILFLTIFDCHILEIVFINGIV